MLRTQGPEFEPPLNQISFAPGVKWCILFAPGVVVGVEEEWMNVV